MLAGFFDGFLLGVTIIVGLLMSFDWLVGENGRRKLRERVGDFWTRLQYQSLDELYVRAFQKLSLRLKRIYGEKVLSARFLLIAFATNVLWVAVFFVGLWRWVREGVAQVAPSIPRETYIGLALTALVFSLLSGWYPIANFFRVVQRFSTGASLGRVFYSLLYILWNAVLFFIIAAVIIMLAWLMFLFVVFGFENWMHLVEQIASEKAMGLDSTKSETWNDFGGRILLPFMVVIVLLLVPISALPFFISLFVVLMLACLKLLRPLLQPLISLFLERLYESKQGVLTQIALGLGALSKLVQEVLKHMA